ncbi:hypothetical protein EZV62_015645 [Acer yangbiense]|uniref:DUF8039 domain-containing protein n=1 Tax=Acer yangbiense TaxID=1000413 RepID=A0A5C7HND6_9ROSI|nr:hypothetical protein EZV62_015645 [Acer yangbiense]
MLTEENSGTPSSSLNDKGSKKKKARGSNRYDFNKITKAKEIGVPINDLGQPHGESSIHLSTSCGAMAAQLIPVTYKNWLEVPEIMKESVWETIKNRFGLDDIAKDHVLASMSTCWRQYKSRITKQIRNVPPGPEASRKLQLLKPDNISDIAEWDRFVKFRKSQEFDEISKRYIQLAKKNETPHTTSRKGFARLREELAEMKAIPLDKTKLVKDDAVAQVLGNEHRGRGRGRGLGLGVTPTKVHAVVIGKTTTMQLQQEMKDLRQLVKELQNAFNNQSPLGVSTSEKDASPQKGTKCKLLHWIGNRQILAKVEIDCTDPQSSVHHKILGPDYWRVCVKKIMVSDVPLIRDTSELQTLEDARGTFIAWPSKYITY